MLPEEKEIFFALERLRAAVHYRKPSAIADPAYGRAVWDLPVAVIFVHGFGCNNKGAAAAEAAAAHWMKWTKDHVGLDVAPKDVYGFCNPDNMQIFKSVVRSAAFRRPPASDFSARVEMLASMKLASHRVLMLGDSYGGGIVNGVAEALAGHEYARNLGVRTFGATYIPATLPWAVWDWVNFMFVDDMAIELNRLVQPDPAGTWKTSYEPRRRVLWLQTGYPRQRRADMMDGRMTVHRQYGAIYKAMIARPDLRGVYIAGSREAAALAAGVSRIGVRDPDAFKQVDGFGMPKADPAGQTVEHSEVAPPPAPGGVSHCPVCLDAVDGPVMQLTCGGHASAVGTTIEACTKRDLESGLKGVGDTVVRLLCGHELHAECLLQLSQVAATNKCPVCSAAIAVGSPVVALRDGSFILQELQAGLHRKRVQYRRALGALHGEGPRFPRR